MATVLIVDDAAFMRLALQKVLVPGGHEVVGEAGNGKEAIELYKEVKPDFVLMDITMPDMDGIEAVRRIKELDKDAKIIMCSALGQQAKIFEAIEAGALDFIVKPFQAKRVLGAIERYSK